MSLSLAGDKQDVVDYGNVIMSGWSKQYEKVKDWLGRVDKDLRR